MSQTASLTADRSPLWLKSKGWDLVWITGSVLLVTIPYASFYAGRAVGFDPDDARNAVNMLVAFLIGGPHMYATHLRSTLDADFRARHKSIYLAALVIPAIVLYFGYYHFVLLLTFFFLWASVHVLHQIIYIVDCYNGRMTRSSSASKWIDYSVVLTALYPVAMYRFVQGTFKVGQNTLFFPDFLKHDAVWWLASAAFATALTLFILKTFHEFREGRGNIPKTLLISVTAVASFVTPMFRELDVAFQGMNTWHSFQYLGLTWYINRLRYDRGELAPRVSLLSREWWRYYGFNMTLNIATLLTIALMLLTRSFTGLSFDQCYYMVVLCFLLTHYYHDHIIFSERADLSVLAVPVR
jgi:hypothetical protein